MIKNKSFLFVQYIDSSKSLKQISEQAVDFWSLVGNLSVGDPKRSKLLRQRLRLREENKLYPPRLGVMVQRLGCTAHFASGETPVTRALVVVDGVEPLVETELVCGGSLTVQGEAGKVIIELKSVVHPD